MKLKIYKGFNELKSWNITEPCQIPMPGDYVSVGKIFKHRVSHRTFYDDCVIVHVE